MCGVCMVWFKNRIAWEGNLYFADVEAMEQWLDLMSEKYGCRVLHTETTDNGHVRAHVRLYN